MRRIPLALCCTLAIVAAVVPASAHHSLAANFDQNKLFTIQGTLTKLDWVNPHAYFYVDVRELDGTVRRYAFEGLPPGMMRRLGMSRETWTSNIGQPVTVKAMAARDGTPTRGFGLVVTFADGKSWEIFPPEQELAQR